MPEGEGGHTCPTPWCGSRKCHSHLICNTGLLTNIPAVVGKSLRNWVYVITYFCYNICVQLLLQSSLRFSFCLCIPAPSNKLQNPFSSPLFSRLFAIISCKLEMKHFISWEAIHRWCVYLDGCGFKCVSCLDALNSQAI